MEAKLDVGSTTSSNQYYVLRLASIQFVHVNFGLKLDKDMK
ncbi:hypothetical protein VIBNIFTn2_120121 [Vibrio nigripulchritudo FTn2]|nr:hypothetical protein VIBNIFTn2_120121 [Vibrio nigripulchritudo FTn2]